MSDDRDLGVLGESTLRQWAAQVAITANKAESDKAGWDFVLDFPLPHRDAVLPLDKAPAPLQCFVQVKATDGRRRRCSIKLDNWIRLIETRLPAFFLVLEFDKQPYCQRAFLVHVGQQYISAVLKRLREADAEQQAKLHKQTLDVTYEEKDQLLTCDGVGLREAIRRHVGERPEEYAFKKLNLLKTLGYEDATHNVNLRIKMPVNTVEDAYRYLVDFYIGRISHLEISAGEIRDVRFGIISPEPEDILEAGRLELVRQGSSEVSTITLCTADGKKQARLTAEEYLPNALQGIVPDEFLQARYALPFVDVVLGLHDPKAFSLEFNLPNFKERLKLKQLQPLAEIVLILDHAYQHNTAVQLEIMSDSRVIRQGALTPTSTVAASLIDLVAIIRRAWSIAKHFEIHDDVDVLATELVRYASIIELISTAISDHRAPIRVSTSIAAAVSKQKICVPYASYLPLGQYGVAVALALVGIPKAVGQVKGKRRKYVIDTSDIRLVRARSWPRSNQPLMTIAALTQAVIDEYQETKVYSDLSHTVRIHAKEAQQWEQYGLPILPSDQTKSWIGQV